ncbi:MAG: alpha/beta hydrolase [Lachnospiraceae bacterium]|nr:alpha/beta hydrolase [Lachnospiraceae bacterium]
MKRKFNTIITLSTLTAISIHIINKLVCSFSTVKEKLSGSENHYYEWRFGKIRYTVSGSGSPILMIHDLTIGSSQYEYHKLLHELAKNHEVYAIDLLGYGLSDKPNMTYTNYMFVELINDFIKTIIGRKTDIIASGDSAPIALMSCHNDNHLINRMILINPQSLYQLNTIPSKQSKILKLLFEVPVIGTFIFNLMSSKKRIENDFHNKYYYNKTLINSNDIDTYVESSHLNDSSSRYSFASYIGKYTNTNIIHALKEIDNGIYLICGEEKEDIKTIVENYVYYNPSIENSYIKDTKQLPQLEQPEELLKQILLYLN